MSWFHRDPQPTFTAPPPPPPPAPFTANGRKGIDGTCTVELSDPSRVTSCQYTQDKDGKSHLTISFGIAAPPAQPAPPAPPVWGQQPYRR